jgi:hypothetical protein
VFLQNVARKELAGTRVQRMRGSENRAMKRKKLAAALAHFLESLYKML